MRSSVISIVAQAWQMRVVRRMTGIPHPLGELEGGGHHVVGLPACSGRIPAACKMGEAAGVLLGLGGDWAGSSATRRIMPPFTPI